MSSGYVHNTVSIAAAGAGFVAMLHYGQPVEAAMLFSAGCLAGIVLTPDLDQQTYNRIENKWRKSKNPLVAMMGLLYIMFWMPYALAIPHRSWLSHAPIIGTVLRILYILLFSSIILAVLGVAVAGLQDYIPLLWMWIPNNFIWFAPFLYGLATSDGLHWLLDRKIFRFLNRSFGL